MIHDTLDTCSDDTEETRKFAMHSLPSRQSTSPVNVLSFSHLHLTRTNSARQFYKTPQTTKQLFACSSSCPFSSLSTTSLYPKNPLLNLCPTHDKLTNRVPPSFLPFPKSEVSSPLASKQASKQATQLPVTHSFAHSIRPRREEKTVD